jgi:hypothetical protein
VRNSYPSPAPPKFSPRTRAPRRKLPVGLERPMIHFGHGIVCKSGVAPAQHAAIPRPS